MSTSQDEETGGQMVEEMYGDETGDEFFTESAPTNGGGYDVSMHKSVSNAAARREADEQDREAMESAGPCGEFETVEGWEAPERAEAEGEEAEPTIEAYYASADPQEFFPLLAAIAPLAKAALPVVGKAVISSVGRPLLSQLLARRRLVRSNRRESDLMEADDAAMAEALSQLETVIGKDDRRQVKRTEVNPWNRICHLSIRSRQGTLLLGTGFLIGPRTVITAGHCVYLHGQGGWADYIDISPARNADSRPYGKVRARDFRTVVGWAKSKTRECDYGCIILPKSFEPTGRRIGAFGFANLPNAQLSGKYLNLSGYPGDKPPGTQWYDGRVAKRVEPRVLIYEADTYGGHSGSPVWIREGNRRTVVGIHTNGSINGNSATRIMGPVFNNMKAWRDEVSMPTSITMGRQLQAPPRTKQAGASTLTSAAKGFSRVEGQEEPVA